MKRLLGDLKQMITMWRCFIRQQQATVAALGVVYSGVIDVTPVENEQWSITIRITPFGDVFNVVKLTSADNRIMQRESWLAVYQSTVDGGYFAEIGGPHYCVFNHAHKALYLEGNDGEGLGLTVLYQQNPDL